ncbi:hypothetical protein [Nonlabens ulvanivorans]|uniref:hypothetical protein n=1 Tax=Nonlabens ulvanivorans TaxID=906888 RepID=UPI002943189B|nr:hypothetical protein [Nonlabens ulvanivorans]WOI21616.1 hypothetical protein R1T42_07965 [Nonlabens ulvanivorans]
MIRLLILFITSFIFINCSDKESYVNSFDIIELKKNDKCSVYLMKFKPDEDILFKISTSGNCEDFSADLFLDSFKKAIIDYINVDKENLKGKYILIEYPNEIEISKESIIINSEKLIKSKVHLEINESSDFKTIKVVIET